MSAPLHDDALVAALKLRVASWKSAKDDELLPVPLGTLRAFVAALAAHQAPAPADAGVGVWVPIETAPKDRIIWVYAPGVQELEPITCLCEWHEDAGFCVDELRVPTLWQALQSPAAPKETGHEG